MIFYGSNYDTMRYARSHSLELSLSTSNAQYKSLTESRTTYPVAKSGLWKMTAELIYTDQDYKTFMQYLIDNEKVICMYGQATNYDGSPSEQWQAGYGYRGKAVVTSVHAEAATGDVATISLELSGCTPLLYCHYTDEWGTSSEWSPAKLDPDISFEHASDEVAISQSNLYQISDLLNPNELSVRFVVLPYRGRVIKDIELVETRDILSDSQVITDIMLSTLAPGTYTILAIFDGDDTYNPAQVEYTITILEDGQQPVIRPAEPVETPTDTQKYDPVFYFEELEQSREQNLQNKYKVQLPVNPANLPVTWTLPEGVTIDASNQLTINDLGTYTITASTLGNSTYNSATATYTLTINEAQVDEKQYVTLRWVDPPSIYRIDQQGEYELPTLYNPQNVPVTITSSNPAVTVIGNTIHAPEGAVFTITASFSGSSFYWPASDSFTAQVAQKQPITLYWSQNNVTTQQNQYNMYELPQLVNPGNYPVSITVSNPNASVDSDNILHYNTYGTLTIQAVFAGDVEHTYTAATLTYTIQEHIILTPDISFVNYDGHPVTMSYQPDINAWQSNPANWSSIIPSNPQAHTLSYTLYEYYNSQWNSYTLTNDNTNSWLYVPYCPHPTYYDSLTQSYAYSYIRAEFSGNYDYYAYYTDYVFDVGKVSLSGLVYWAASYIIPTIDDYDHTKTTAYIHKPEQLSYRDFTFTVHTRLPEDTYIGAVEEKHYNIFDDYYAPSYFFKNIQSAQRAREWYSEFPASFVDVNYSYDARQFYSYNYTLSYLSDNADEIGLRLAASFPRPYKEIIGISYLEATFSGDDYYESYTTQLPCYEYYYETPAFYDGWWSDADKCWYTNKSDGRLYAYIPRNASGIYNLSNYGYIYGNRPQHPSFFDHPNTLSYHISSNAGTSYVVLNESDENFTVYIPQRATTATLQCEYPYYQDSKLAVERSNGSYSYHRVYIPTIYQHAESVYQVKLDRYGGKLRPVTRTLYINIVD